jgi:hypothetical protein
MNFALPFAFVVFGIVVELLLKKGDATWEQHVAGIQQRDAEIVKRVRARQSRH